MTVATADRIDPATLLTALDQRLARAGAVLLDELPRPHGDRPGGMTAAVLPMLVQHCRPADRTDARWLLLTAAFGAFPTGDQLADFGRRLELMLSHQAESALLADILAAPGRGRVDLPIEVVTGGVLVDVDFSARNDTHTGIHRVVRETVPRWLQDPQRDRPVHSVAWIDEYSAFRPLTPRETARILSYGRETPDGSAPEPGPTHLLVPWGSVVILPDVPNGQVDERLAALAQYSGNTLSLIGYDMIPITSAETRPFADSVAFAQYLSVVKHAHRVTGISRSATVEFSGFARSVRAQGLPGPEVRTVELTTEAPGSAPPVPAERNHARPVVLCPGSLEPHKNQRGVLHAAERLWREGLDFEVRLMGGPGWSDEVLRPVVRRLRADGRPLTELGRVDDQELTAQMYAADFVVFVSLHEGYGLPVAEALSCGTPVVTSNFGSQRQIAEGGGCLLVDPRDDDDVTRALRTLLTSPEELERLRAEIRTRPRRTWTQYADELWAFLVEGVDAA